MKVNSKLKTQNSKVKKGLYTAVFVLLSAAWVQAAVNNSAGIVFPELENGAGSRAAAMAGAYTAVADDAGSVYWNPAGLARVKKTELALTWDSWFMDSFFDNAMFAMPLPVGVLGAEVFYMNFGSFARTDDLGNSLSGRITPFTFAGFVSYGIDLGGGVSAGVTAKIISQSIGDDVKNGYAGDAGVIFKTGIISAGLAARNFGTGGAFTLPSDIRLGFAVNPEIIPAHNLIIALDADYIFNDAFYAAAGAEYTIEKVFSLRAGYKYRAGENNPQGLGGITAGMGVKLGAIGFDYAYMPFGELGTSHRAVIKFDFGAPGKAPLKSVQPEKKEAPAALSGSEEKMYKMFFEAGTLENSGNLTAAAEKYKEMLKADSTYAPAWKRLGAVFVKMKKMDQAKKCFEAYMKLKPDDTAVKKWLEKNK